MTIPPVYLELHVPDFQLVLDFYGALGFRVVWAEPDYLTMKFEDSVLCFYGGTSAVSDHSYFSNFPSNTPRGFGVEIIIFVRNLDEVYQRAKPLAAIVSDVRLRPWGVRDFRIADPNGLYIRVSERYDIVERAEKIAQTATVLRSAGLVERSVQE